MSGSRIKTIIIAALVLINALFLTVIIIDSYNDLQSERLAIVNLCAVMENGGIRISPEDIRTGGELRSMRTARGDDIETVITHAVLGSAEKTDQGGGIYRYESEGRGFVEFSSGGDFEFRLETGVVPETGGAQRVVSRILRDMKLETSELTISEGQTGEGLTGVEPDSLKVTAVCSYKGVSIFNCTIDFIFSNNSLQTIKGRYIAGVEPEENSVKISGVSTVLLGFLAVVQDETREDVFCSEIFSVEAGYRHRIVSAFGEGLIDPVWLIITDSGHYLVDDVTGDIRLVM